jgi:hypothetical protein
MTCLMPVHTSNMINLFVLISQSCCLCCCLFILNCSDCLYAYYIYMIHLYYSICYQCRRAQVLCSASPQSAAAAPAPQICRAAPANPPRRPSSARIPLTPRMEGPPPPRRSRKSAAQISRASPTRPFHQRLARSLQTRNSSPSSTEGRAATTVRAINASPAVHSPAIPPRRQWKVAPRIPRR